jgi:hypothetical protein
VIKGDLRACGAIPWRSKRARNIPIDDFGMSIDLACQFACKIKCRWPVDFLGLQNAILLNTSLEK